MKKSVLILIILIFFLLVSLIPNLPSAGTNSNLESIFIRRIILYGIFIIILYGICHAMFRISNNRIVKNKYGEVRIVWKASILLIAIGSISGLITNACESACNNDPPIGKIGIQN